MCCASALLFAAACSEHETPKAAIEPVAIAPRDLAVVTAQHVDMQRTVRATGTIFGDEQTTIAAKVSGRVLEVHVDFGDKALPGQPIVTIDPLDYELARDERTMAFQQALARLGLTELPGEDFDLASLPTIERARLEAENARVRYERGKRLADRNPPLISEQDFEDLRTTWEVAQSDLRVQELEAKAGLAEARVLDAQRRIAEQRVADTVHRAPEDVNAPNREYVVARRLVAVGDFVQVGTPLAELIDTNPVKLRATIPERMIGSVKIGQPASVRVESFDGTVQGVVTRISPAVSERTRTNMVEITIPNDDHALKPGAFATAEIAIGTVTVVAVPHDAITTFAGVSKVYVVRDGKVEPVRIEMGDSQGEFVEVMQGLTGEERVVRRPPADLLPGTPVREAVADRSS